MKFIKEAVPRCRPFMFKHIFLTRVARFIYLHFTNFINGVAEKREEKPRRFLTRAVSVESEEGFFNE